MIGEKRKHAHNSLFKLTCENVGVCGKRDRNRQVELVWAESKLISPQADVSRNQFEIIILLKKKRIKKHKQSVGKHLEKSIR